jgi:hypothetical protein
MSSALGAQSRFLYSWRAFIRLRDTLAAHKELAKKLARAGAPTYWLCDARLGRDKLQPGDPITIRRIETSTRRCPSRRRPDDFEQTGEGEPQPGRERFP